MKTNALILLAALLAVPSVGWGQTPEDRVDTTVERAEERGIPVTLLEGKIREGQAKGVPMETIASAVEQRLEGLTRAREAMEGAVPEGVGAGELSVGADALESGVSETVLAELSGETEPGDRTVAVAALTHLVGEGVVPEEALDRVRGALERGGPPALAEIPGFAGPPADVPGAENRPEDAGPPASVPGPGEAGPPEDRPGPDGPGGGPPGPPGG